MNNLVIIKADWNDGKTMSRTYELEITARRRDNEEVTDEQIDLLSDSLSYDVDLDGDDDEVTLTGKLQVYLSCPPEEIHREMCTAQPQLLMTVESLDVLHGPDQDSIWACAECGESAVFEDTDPDTAEYNYPTDCPSCQASMTKPNAVRLTVSINETPMEHMTKLTADGDLVDVDRLVANGYHSQTCCAQCDHDLQEEADD